MKKIIFVALSAFLLCGCVSVSPYVLTKTQTILNLSNNRAVALFTLKVMNPGGSRFLLSSFTVREANQYKPYNTLGYFSIPLTEENYSVPDDLYFCTVVLNRGIYRMDAFNGMTNSFFAVPYALKSDKIFDMYPGTINYMGRFDFGNLDTKVTSTPLKGVEDAYVQDVEKFRSIFPVLKDKKIGRDSFY
ncbi:MAG: hypothetical protein Q8K15_00115 [Candidatus Omnitrophota bacterium]|nr:hypothetical protein [Candidatus Omnitrophota bacterium]